MKRIYRKRKFEYWGRSTMLTPLGWIYLALIAYIALVAIARHYRAPLVSPIAYGIVTPVQAKEPEVFISCDTPRGYLECKAYQGVITWAEHDKLSKIIQCESGWRVEAINKNNNGTFDFGLFQINSVHKQKALDMFDFKKNIDFGLKLFKAQGVTPWVCAKKI